MTAEYTLDAHSTGLFCGYIENGHILAMAGVDFTSDREWELQAVSADPMYRNKGLTKAVCSFAVTYILENGRAAACETNRANCAMRRVLIQIGMKLYMPENGFFRKEFAKPY